MTTYTFSSDTDYQWALQMLGNAWERSNVYLLTTALIRYSRYAKVTHTER